MCLFQIKLKFGGKCLKRRRRLAEEKDKQKAREKCVSFDYEKLKIHLKLVMSNFSKGFICVLS
jgi:hypothetical protein